jgi:hypothetical protein
MADLVYILCAAASVVCAALLLRSWWRARTRLLLWCCLCFVGLALNNLLLLVDLWGVPDIDLSLWRAGVAFAGISTLLYGLIWETR